MPELRSTWLLPAPPEEVWAVLADAATWPRWWPGLRSEVIAIGTAEGLGTRGHLVFRAPLGYRIRIGLEVLESEPPHRVLMRAVGDLRGRARASVAPDGDGGTRVEIEWDVDVRRLAMRWADRVAPTFSRVSHGVVMRAGERGLRRHLGRR